ncbi:MAG: molybdate ABC transporter substrate-binding protein [Tepidisphaeraceae bacterium]
MSRLGVVAVLLVLSLAAAPLGAEKVTVFAAVSLKDALSDVARQYESSGGDQIEFSFGASGQLATQIVEGAPADVFISAAQKQVKDLVAAKVADEASRAVIASNRLVLIVPKDASNPIHSFPELADARVKKISIGQPRTVPAGEYATQVLAKLKIEGAVRDRLVYGANVRQVLDYVRRGEVDAGVVYATDAASTADVKVVATADESLHEQIIYPAVTITRSEHRAAAERFMKHLQGEAAQKILRERGFVAPTTRPSAP